MGPGVPLLASVGNSIIAAAVGNRPVLALLSPDMSTGAEAAAVALGAAAAAARGPLTHSMNVRQSMSLSQLLGGDEEAFQKLLAGALAGEPPSGHPSELRQRPLSAAASAAAAAAAGVVTPAAAQLAQAGVDAAGLQGGLRASLTSLKAVGPVAPLLSPEGSLRCIPVSTSQPASRHASAGGTLGGAGGEQIITWGSGVGGASTRTTSGGVSASVPVRSSSMPPVPEGPEQDVMGSCQEAAMQVLGAAADCAAAAGGGAAGTAQLRADVGSPGEEEGEQVDEAALLEFDMLDDAVAQALISHRQVNQIEAKFDLPRSTVASPERQPVGAQHARHLEQQQKQQQVQVQQQKQVQQPQMRATGMAAAPAEGEEAAAAAAAGAAVARRSSFSGDAGEPPVSGCGGAGGSTGMHQQQVRNQPGASDSANAAGAAALAATAAVNSAACAAAVGPNIAGPLAAAAAAALAQPVAAAGRRHTLMHLQTEPQHVQILKPERQQSLPQPGHQTPPAPASPAGGMDVLGRRATTDGVGLQQLPGGSIGRSAGAGAPLGAGAGVRRSGAGLAGLPPRGARASLAGSGDSLGAGLGGAGGGGVRVSVSQSISLEEAYRVAQGELNPLRAGLNRQQRPSLRWAWEGC